MDKHTLEYDLKHCTQHYIHMILDMDPYSVHLYMLYSMNIRNSLHIRVYNLEDFQYTEQDNCMKELLGCHYIENMGHKVMVCMGYYIQQANIEVVVLKMYIVSIYEINIKINKE